MDREERGAKLASEAERIARLLVERGATLVVVFGSVARGDTGRWSDLDMNAVMQSDLPFIKRLGELYIELGATVGLDLLVYTPKEWEYMQHRGFVRHALAEGRVLDAA
jgi:predicted nucleotidyltransferase